MSIIRLGQAQLLPTPLTRDEFKAMSLAMNKLIKLRVPPRHQLHFKEMVDNMKLLGTNLEESFYLVSLVFGDLLKEESVEKLLHMYAIECPDEKCGCNFYSEGCRQCGSPHSIDPEFRKTGCCSACGTH